MNTNNISAQLAQFYETLRALNRGWASQKVRDIVEKCSAFKIGKTGETLEERFAQPDYINKYDHITEVFKNSSKREVDEMESYLISRYLLNVKCDNLKDGIASKGDNMCADTKEYFVYVVWKE